MKITIEKNVVEFSPANAEETEQLEALWRTVVDCVRFNKKMVPVGHYVPGENQVARFSVEDIQAEGFSDLPEVFAEKDCRCFCQTCNKYIMLNKGDRIPPCCGNLMEVMD